MVQYYFYLDTNDNINIDLNSFSMDTTNGPLLVVIDDDDYDGYDDIFDGIHSESTISGTDSNTISFDEHQQENNISSETSMEGNTLNV